MFDSPLSSNPSVPKEQIHNNPIAGEIPPAPDTLPARIAVETQTTGPLRVVMAVASR